MPFRVVIGGDWQKKPGQEDIEPKEYMANNEPELRKILKEYGELKEEDIAGTLEEARSARQVSKRKKTGLVITIYSLDK